VRRPLAAGWRWLREHPGLIRRLGAGVIVLLIVLYVIDAKDEASEAHDQAAAATAAATLSTQESIENGKRLDRVLEELRKAQLRDTASTAALVVLTKQLRDAGLAPQATVIDTDGDGVPEVREQPSSRGPRGPAGPPGPAGSPAPRPSQTASPKASPSPTPCFVRNPVDGSCLYPPPVPDALVDLLLGGLR
jgi:hypothetical protein